MKHTKILLAACAAFAFMQPASATTITNGPVSLGLFDNAGLGSGSVGLSLSGIGDAITPGCLCEGWGVAADGDGAHYVYGGAGTGFASAVASDVTASTFTSTVATTNGLTVVHKFTPVAGGTLFQIDVSITNDSGADVTDVRYARTLDWDVPPGHFSDDFTTIYGGTPTGPGGKVFHTSTDPFAVPNPMVTRTQEPDMNVTDTPGDKGGYFIFKFGDLLIGESTSFTTHIGASRTLAGLLGAMAGVGVEAYSYTQDNDGDWAFGYGFGGLGLPPVFDVPAPLTLGLFGAGLLGMGAARRRKAA